MQAQRKGTHDDVTQRATAPMILKKIIDLALRIELTLANIFATTVKRAKKFDHKFSHLFIFRNIFAQDYGFEAKTVKSSKYFVSHH